MNKRTRQAALQLLLLQEEFTKKELDEAAAALSENESGTVLELLRNNRPKGAAKSAAAPSSWNQQMSKVVRDLQASDPQRYSILREFELMLRKGELLPMLDDIKRFGASASKEFQPGKSRKEAIARLMSVLAELPLDSLRETVGRAAEQSRSREEGDQSYARLAHYLIGENERAQ